MRIAGFIISLAFWAAILSPMQGATLVKEDTKGVVLIEGAGDSTKKPEARLFDQLYHDQAYINIKTPDGLLIHLIADRVVKYVLFLKPDTFPSQFQPEDLAVVKAKIDELRTAGAASPSVQALVAPHLKYLQGIYDTESARYKHSVVTANQQAMTEQEQAVFDKKCDLMRIDLIASKDNIKRSEEIVKEMEPLAARSPMITKVLAKWNDEKTRALKLADEGKALWKEAQAAHPQSFTVLKQVGEVPDFPEDVKKKGLDLSARLDEFRTSAYYPQTITYCQAEIPAFFLLNQLPKMVEKMKAARYEEASVVAQKAFTQAEERQIVDPYKPILDTVKNYKNLSDDVRSRFLLQLAKAKRAEDEATDAELLGEYQKAYDLIPDPKVAGRLEQLKARLKAK